MTEQVWWYATRAAGLMTWSTAVASVLLGLLLSTRLLGKKPSGPWLLDVHRFLGGLSAVFLLIHLGSLWADSFVEFGPVEFLVPGQSTWNPSADFLGLSAVTWGIGAAYALIAVQITSILRRHVRPGLWRAVHYLSVVTVVAGSVHAYQAGTDVENPLVMGTAIGSSILVVLLSLLRMRSASNPESQIAQERMLAEMRQRLDSMPMPDQTAQPSLDQGEQSSLPRRAPVRSGGNDIKAISMNDQVIFAPEPEIEPDFVAPMGENTLLAGLDEPIADQLGADPFAGLQGPDSDFDPGGWSSEPSSAAAETFERPAPGEFAPPPPALSAEPQVEEAPLSDSPIPHDEPSTDVTPEFDARSFLAELDTLASPLPIPDSLLDPAPRSPAPPEPPHEPIPAPPEPAHEPVATEPEPPHEPIPASPEPPSVDSAQIDVWETALESLLGEGLPKLPSFDAPEIPDVAGPAAIEDPAAQSVEPLLPPSLPPTPIVEPVSFEPQPTSAAIPPAVVEPDRPTPDLSIPEQPPSVEPSPSPTPPPPPPLPVHAIDPTTGKTDENAYKDWLVEWLAYAERYGDEAPADPTRVDR